MTDMKRITVSLTDDLVEAIAELKQQDEYKHKSFSEMIRLLSAQGIVALRTNAPDIISQ